MKQYIDKSAVVAEIEKRLHTNGAFDEFGDEAWAEDVGMCNAYKSILSFINSLEVKDVDLEKEIELIKGDYEQVDVAWNNDFDYIARHFFELGIRAQKGE